jgi:FAD/FMN-containing dehydrogenase
MSEAPRLISSAQRGEDVDTTMRPQSLDEFVGQEHLLGPGKPLRDAIERGTPGSMIFWGPPGSGKTTLAHLVASTTERVFVPFSAVTEGVPRIREILNEARARLVCIVSPHAPSGTLVTSGAPDEEVLYGVVRRVHEAQAWTMVSARSRKAGTSSPITAAGTIPKLLSAE